MDWNLGMMGLNRCDKMVLEGMLKSVLKYLDSRLETAALCESGIS